MSRAEQQAEAIVTAIAIAVRPLVDRIAALERAAGVQPAKPKLKLWSPTMSYQQGDLVLHAGVTWMALRTSPGIAPAATVEGYWLRV